MSIYWEKYYILYIIYIYYLGTLLNSLFGTKFNMMDSTLGRKQTTRGIWLENSIKVPNTIIMDMEGTDSAERGEDRESFERQTGLYGLALAEILIVNMWYHDIGRYTASNFGILKTIFEVNLQLFKNGSKSTILFIIRDYEMETPLSTVSDRITNEMELIWKELHKPDEFKDISLESAFEFRFHDLPHLKHQKELWNSSVEDMREWFTNPEHSQYLFGTNHHLKKSVPARDFAQYSSDIWANIRQHKELNLPSQKDMIATFRCEEFAKDCLKTFKSKISAQSLDKYDENLGKHTELIYNEVLSEYDFMSEFYSTEVAHRKRDELKNDMIEEFHNMFNIQMQHAVLDIMESFKACLHNALPQDGKFASDFISTIKKISDDCYEGLKVKFEQSKLHDANWSMDSFVEMLHDKIKFLTQMARKDQLALLNEFFNKEVVDKVQPVIGAIFHKTPEDMWAQIRESLKATLTAIDAEVIEATRDFDLSEEERLHFLESLNKQGSETVLSGLKSQAMMVVLKMKKKFETMFCYDNSGLPRLWRKSDDMPALYVNAKKKGLEVLEAFSKFQLDENAEVVEVLSESDRSLYEMHFREEIDHILRDAEWKMAKLAESNVPWWIFVVILFLGWTELMAVLSNPILLILALGCGFVGLAYYASENNLEALGPFGEIVKQLLANGLGKLQNNLQVTPPNTNTKSAHVKKDK